MIICLLLTIIAFVLFLHVLCSDMSGIVGNIGWAFLALIGAFMVFIFVGVLGFVVSKDLVSEDMVTMGKDEITEIVAIKDGNSVDGSLFIGCGHVDNDLYYYYAEETECGYSIQKINAGECYLEYTDTTPRIVRQTADGFKNKWNYIWLFPFYERITIYVPPGTIDPTLNIDLQ